MTVYVNKLRLVNLGFLLMYLQLSLLQVYSKLKARNSEVGLPEHRVPLMVPSAVLVPVGFFWYGWSIQSQLHWIMPNIGSVLFGSGIIIGMQCITSYIIDAYSLYAASALAATTVLRAIAGFGETINSSLHIRMYSLTVCRIPAFRAIHVSGSSTRLG